MLLRFDDVSYCHVDKLSFENTFSTSLYIKKIWKELWLTFLWEHYLTH